MKKLRYVIAVILITVLLFIPVSLSILSAERDKKLAHAQDELEAFKQWERDSEEYRQKQLAYIKQTVEENKKNMEAAKLSYEYLLNQQASILAEHQKQVPTTQTQPVQTVTVKKSTSGSSSSSTKAPSKPTSTRSTKAS